MSAWWRAALLGVALPTVIVGGGCGGDDGGAPGDDDEAATTTTTIVENSTTGSTTPTDPVTPGSGPINESAGTIPGSSEPAEPPPADLTGEEVCELLPGEAVSTALDVPVAASPGRTDTPQCSYRFAGSDGVATEATVAALRTDGDLDGRLGADAFAYVLDLNRRAAVSPPSEMSLSAGDQGVILTGNNLHVGVIQLSGRVVTVIVPTGAAELGAVTALAAAAAAALVP